MLDVFFINMDEIDADKNFARLLEFVPNAQRIQHIEGIYNVHRTCAERSTTDNFWVVDADAWIVNGFNFEWEPDPTVMYWDEPETNCVINWPSINPVNGLSYGYGAVKVFPRKPFLDNTNWSIDVSSSMTKVIIGKEQISCETRFNSTPKSAWIGAFRECAKLSSLTMLKRRIRSTKQIERKELENIVEYTKQQAWNNTQKNNYRRTQSSIIENRYNTEKEIYSYWEEMELMAQRQLVWCTTGWHEKNGKFSILGAQAGAKFGLAYSDNLETLNLINDWNWLSKQFKEFEKNVNV